jgi:hypothetical protein
MSAKCQSEWEDKFQTEGFVKEKREKEEILH